MRLAHLLIISLCAAMAGALMFPAGALAQGWYARGQYYNASLEFEVPGLWGVDSGNELLDDGTNGDAVAGDGILSRLITSSEPAGHYEFKVGTVNWSDGAPDGFNINLMMTTTEANQQVLITFDTNVYNDGWMPTTRIIWCDRLTQPQTGWFVVGNAPELGVWDPAVSPVDVGLVPTDGIFQTTVAMTTVGMVEYKWTVDRQWIIQEVSAQGYCIRDGRNLAVDVLQAGDIDFFMNPATGRAAAGPTGTVAAKDASWSRIKALYLD